MRYLAIDLGDKRTGLALGDDTTGIVSPAGVLEVQRGTALLEAIRASMADHEPDAIVIGLPINMDDTEGDRAKLVRAFGAELGAMIDIPIHFQDERLTSVAADAQMARSGRTHKQKKKLRDALAAAEILRDFLDAGG